MALRDLANKYLGWCPRLFSPITRLPPISQLPTSGKVGFIVVLLVWSLGSLFQGFIYLTQNIPGRLDLLGYPNIARAFLMTVMVFPFGLSLTILIADYLLTGRVVKRHGIELLAVVVIGAIPMRTFSETRYSGSITRDVPQTHTDGIPMQGPSL